MPTHSSDPYYKIIVPNTPGRKNPTMIIACLSAYDELDYNANEWLWDDDGDVSFDTQEEAREYLAKHVHHRWIDDEDKMTPANTHVDNFRWKH